ncbi:MAG: hypothetical protein AB7L09_02050 [Nitrospira sp.]
MKIEVGYQTASRAFPAETQEVLDKLRKSRSRWKNADPNELTWVYSWCVSTKSYSVKDLLDGKTAAEASRRSEMTLDERIADQLARTYPSVGVNAPRGGAYYASLPRIPDEIIAHTTDAMLSDEQDRKRIKKMTPGERAVEKERLLKSLRGPA